MKILHINSYSYGGAANSCIRLHQGLLNEGVASDMLFIQSSYKDVPKAHYYSTTPHVPPKPTAVPGLQSRIKRKAGRILKELNLYPSTQRTHKPLPNLTHQDHLLNRPKGYDAFSPAGSPYDITTRTIYQDADLIHLHWTANFMDYKRFFSKNTKKVVWTLHDMYPFTGGCHYSGNCAGYQESCLNCPQLAGTIDVNYANKIWNVKKQGLEEQFITVVTPSEWLKKCSQQSSLFSTFTHKVIPYGLDSAIFQHRDKEYSRKLLGLPADKIVLLFVAENLENTRKGYHYLTEALKQLTKSENIVLCAVGKKQTTALYNQVYELGSILDERLMSVVYSAADVFITPALEDNLPNTVLEALMCGTPVIGFPVGGIPEMIEHNRNGYLCSSIGSSALIESITDFINSIHTFNSKQIREETVQKYNLQQQAKAYIHLYNQLIQS